MVGQAPGHVVDAADARFTCCAPPTHGPCLFFWRRTELLNKFELVDGHIEQVTQRLRAPQLRQLVVYPADLPADRVRQTPEVLKHGTRSAAPLVVVLHLNG